MLQHEFETLTGLEIGFGQYEIINGMYMCNTNQTKEEFCRMFMAMGLIGHVNYVLNLKVEKMELARTLSKKGGAE